MSFYEENKKVSNSIVQSFSKNVDYYNRDVYNMHCQVSKITIAFPVIIKGGLK